MSKTAYSTFQGVLSEIEEAGLTKPERVIISQQQADIEVEGGQKVINFCANNYLGLANNSDLLNSAKEGVDKYGFGLSSVRFICGTQDVHKSLERKIADFFQIEDSILYPSCFDANGGLFETLLDKECAVISDQLNHASIIDGIRLCKAERHRYLHNDMADLEEKLKATQSAKIRMIATDGIFSMDGDVAPIAEICNLADKYDALVMVDDCHGSGFFGPTGRGSVEHCGALGRVDIITSTLGKAMGGASGGFTVAKKEVVDLLRQRSRPYLFSNTLAPVIAHTSLKVIEMISESSDLITKVAINTTHFREGMTAAGFDIRPGVHPIVPIMLYDARLAQDMAAKLLEEGIYVIGFSFPVVPKGEARIRVQISAGHSSDHIDHCIQAFTKIGRELKVIA